MGSSGAFASTGTRLTPSDSGSSLANPSKNLDTPPLLQSPSKTPKNTETLSQTGQKDQSDENTDTTNDEEEKIKQDINNYIIESYKIQGTKIIKDLNTKFIKTIPDNSERRKAFEKIRDALDMREKKIEKMNISETNKVILKEFLSHMVDLLDKRIDELL